MDEFEPMKITQTRGETLSFSGKCLADFSTEKPGKTEFQEFFLYETAKGTWIAVMDVHVRGNNFTTAAVIDAGGDEYARRLAVMDAFEWRSGARRMMRDVAGWTFVREVE